MNRFIKIHIGWPKEELGECLVDASAREENYAVVCYENGEANHAFLVFDEEKIGTICRMWLTGVDAETIDREVISE